MRYFRKLEILYTCSVGCPITVDLLESHYKLVIFMA